MAQTSFFTTEDIAENSLRKLVMPYLWSKELPRGTRSFSGKENMWYVEQ